MHSTIWATISTTRVLGSNVWGEVGGEASVFNISGIFLRIGIHHWVAELRAEVRFVLRVSVGMSFKNYRYFEPSA